MQFLVPLKKYSLCIIISSQNMWDTIMKVPDMYTIVGGVHQTTCLLVYLLTGAIRYRPPAARSLSLDYNDLICMLEK